MKVTYFSVFITVLALTSCANVSLAATCDVMQLSPCLSSITSGSLPSEICCARLKSQKTCLCQYMKNPFLQPYINSPNAQKVSIICGAPFPTC
ncbi:hypothetical protein ACHQM5_009583 [Ranunculus cassubicifolius]